MSSLAILGLDIGGANLKAALPGQRCLSVPFALWRERAQLATALRALIRQFPEANRYAVTMTGELCDCYETSAEGVRDMISALEQATQAPAALHIWTTAGRFATAQETLADPLPAAAANWHALANFAARYAPTGYGLVIDIGSTTTDLIPLSNATLATPSRTDQDRLLAQELVYLGVGRTPAMVLLPPGQVAAELFATTQDALLLLQLMAEDPDSTNTADGRPATRYHAHGRLARMLGGDRETIPHYKTQALAQRIYKALCEQLLASIQFHTEQFANMPSESHRNKPTVAILCGSGEFLALKLANYATPKFSEIVLMSEQLGRDAAVCAPAYAAAVLASEQGL